MAEDQDRLERLISRRLDGEITAGEERELDAMMAASPEARALLQTYERQDGLVRSALCDVLGSPGASLSGPRASVAAREQTEPLGPAGGVHRVFRALRWPMPLAAAAALAVVIGAAVRFGVGGRLNLGPPSDRGALTSRNANGGELTTTGAEASPADEALTGDYPPQTVNREVIGAVGEDGKTVYLLEMDHTRTAIAPASVTF